LSDQLIRELVSYLAGPLSPVPQYWNGTAYEKVEGAHGATKTIIYGADGAPLFTIGNKGYMELPAGAATETTLLSIDGHIDGLEALLTLIAGYTDGLETALALLGTQTTSAAILAKLSADPATQTTLAALSAKFGSLGQKTMALSAPVVLASDQAAIPMTRNGTARTMTHTAPTAGITTGTALATNANRKYALIVNDSANAVYIKLGATAVLNTGIRLNANGGSYEINETNLYTGVIDCISSVATQTLLVTEGV
jgi:hypothetical protein